MQRRHFMRTLLLSVFLIIECIPFLSMLIFCVFSRWSVDSALPQNFSADGFGSFFKRDFGIAVRTTVFSMIASLNTLIICILAVRGLIRMKRPVRKWVEPLFYFPMLLPVVSICIGGHKLLLKLSMTGTFAVMLMHVYFALPYVFQVVYSAHTLLGIKTENTARNLGAKWWRVFWYIHLPVYFRDYLTAYVVGFVISYSQYFVNFYFGSSENINFSMVMSPLLTGANRNLASVYTLMYIVFGSGVIMASSILQRVIHRKIYKRPGDSNGGNSDTESVLQSR